MEDVPEKMEKRMNTNIYYFTGTGNSLDVARKLGEKIENSKVVSIVQTATQDRVASDIIGIVCPIHMFNIPLIVVNFIKKIKSVQYLFIVFAGGGELGSVMKRAQKLCESQNLTLASAFSVTMPSNYTPHGSTPEEKQQECFRNAENKIDEIVKAVVAKKSCIEQGGTSFFKTYIHPGLLYKLGYRLIHSMDKSFFADEYCNGCSICLKVCPAHNITLADKKPQWHNHCLQCYACLQWCPKEAIQNGKKTAGIKRYHHPNVTANDVIKSLRGSR
jgi:formate hydrogenlyase subunit 6/NADH:ubiquinone oxidoreductase subunit I/flavodoxin